MESRRQRSIRETLEEYYVGSFWWKVHGGPFQRSGIPDLCGCVEGLYCAFEIKEPGKPPASVIQRETVKLIRRAGGCAAYGITTAGECIGLINERLAEIRSVSKRRR